jgi:hypothetical protein
MAGANVILVSAANRDGIFRSASDPWRTSAETATVAHGGGPSFNKAT